MYCLLDLITEQGAGNYLGKSIAMGVGTIYAHNTPAVDKIVIAQGSLQAFINALSPGAYSSISKVNFKILDDLILKPIGIYGSKEEIVRFLGELGAVDVNMHVYLSTIRHQKLTLNTQGAGIAFSAR